MATPKKLSFKPLGKYILVETAKPEEKTASGLLIAPTANKERPEDGVIVALGTGRITKSGENIPFNVKVGDHIKFKKYSGSEIEIDNVEYLILDEEAILGINN